MLCVGLLSKLQTVASGRHNALGAPTGCLENTRVVVLDTLMSWAEDLTSTQYVYWLSDLAGTGKTAIMKSLCERLAERQVLGASFFITRAADNRRDPRCILQTLVDQLAYTVPALRRAICDALDAYLDVVELDLELQLRDLLAVPYATSKSNFSQPTVLVIDAFDECRKDKDSGRHGGEFLPLLLRALSRCQPYLKLVIASRLDQPILDMFKDVNPTTMRLHEMDRMAVHSDIRLYLLKGFEHIIAKKRLSLPGRWPTEDEIDLLVGRADKLFVYASTVLKYIGHSAFYPPDEALLLHPPGHPDYLHALGLLSQTLLYRFEHLGNTKDLDEAVQFYRGLLALNSLDHPERAEALNDLGWALQYQYQHAGNTKALAEAISCYGSALELCTTHDAGWEIILGNLASALRGEFKVSGSLESLNRALSLQRESLSLRPLGHEERPESLNNLALATADQSIVSRNPKLLVCSLDMHLEAIKLACLGTVNYANALVGLGETLTSHRARVGELRRFEEAVATFRDTVPYGFLAPRWRSLQGVLPTVTALSSL
jgi:hypothetical protein